MLRQIAYHFYHVARRRPGIPPFSSRSPICLKDRNKDMSLVETLGGGKAGEESSLVGGSN
jgi:hypothetical protein